MQLLEVLLVEKPILMTKKLITSYPKLKSILNKTYKNKHEVYRNFRKIIPSGRYALAISKDASKKHALFICDTQLMDKSN